MQTFGIIRVSRLDGNDNGFSSSTPVKLVMLALQCGFWGLWVGERQDCNQGIFVT